VPETELPLVRAGQGATVTSDQVNGQTNGSVRIVTPEVDATDPSRHRPRQPERRQRLPSRHVRPDRDRRRRPADITVPTASVLYRENKAGVFILGANNQVRFQPGDRADRLHEPDRGRRASPPEPARGGRRRRLPGRRRPGPGQRSRSPGRARLRSRRSGRPLRTPAMKNISSWSIKNPIPIILLFVVLTLAGVEQLHAADQQQSPTSTSPWSRSPP
jgi:hypothetical protein